ncbi:MAG: helix-turn-helix domain-containing protein [Candidatus Manganitrophaceae bacterium]
MRSVVNYIDSHYLSETICLKEVAGEVRWHPKYLCIVFKRACGVGFHEYVMGKKIERAGRLLQNARLSVKEVAGMIGIDPGYFSKVFTQRIGMTPREYQDFATTTDHLRNLPPKMRIVMDYVNQHYVSETICLQEVADVARWHPKYLSIVFKRACGVGFHEYITKKKMEHAAELLLRKIRLSVKEVANNIGMEPRYFTQIFREQVGMAPTYWRDSQCR